MTVELNAAQRLVEASKTLYMSATRYVTDELFESIFGLDYSKLHADMEKLTNGATLMVRGDVTKSKDLAKKLFKAASKYSTVNQEREDPEDLECPYYANLSYYDTISKELWDISITVWTHSMALSIRCRSGRGRIGYPDPDSK